MRDFAKAPLSFSSPTRLKPTLIVAFTNAAGTAVLRKNDNKKKSLSFHALTQWTLLLDLIMLGQTRFPLAIVEGGFLHRSVKRALDQRSL